jgi:phenylpropionate dioxygenase-like ring-hydroxylating dioxygenase large terminal subunit
MIPDRWYPVLESARLGKRPVGVTRLGQRFVLWRAATGDPVAMPSACPHRGAALEQGLVRDGELVCPWHGFRFRADGRCTRLPCEGPDARIPRALDTRPVPTRDEHGLIWLWHGAVRDSLPPVAFFAELEDRRATAETSYTLPYHYTRMIETNLDIHHTPFVHGSVFPVGERVEPFDAKIEGDHVRTWGTLRREGKSGGFDFRAECLLPGLGLVALGNSFRIAIAATPIDADHTWLWFRYHYRRPLLGLGSMLAWLAVQSELRIVQKQDWRIFSQMLPGTIDDVPYRFVHADLGIALYRKRRAELLAESTTTSAH